MLTRSESAKLPVLQQAATLSDVNPYYSSVIACGTPTAPSCFTTHPQAPFPLPLVINTMSDSDLSLLLDLMILAVDEGHSYDGIVSTPELGLEDVGNRAGLLDRGVVRPLPYTTIDNRGSFDSYAATISGAKNNHFRGGQKVNRFSFMFLRANSQRPGSLGSFVAARKLFMTEMS